MASVETWGLARSLIFRSLKRASGPRSTGGNGTMGLIRWKPRRLLVKRSS